MITPKMDQSLARDKFAPVMSVNGLGSMYGEVMPIGENSAFSLKQGVIVEVWAKQGTALVLCSGSNILKCPLNVKSYSTKYGIMDVEIPTIGSFVLVAKRKGADYGVIVCAFPEWGKSTMIDVRTVSELDPSSEEMRDATSYEMEKFCLPGDQIGPILKDSTCGEKYVLSDSGVGYILSKYFMRIQAGDLCNVTLHYLDGILEAFLHNLRVFNSGFFLESICDFGANNTELHLSPLLTDAAKETESERRRNATVRILGGWLANGLHIFSQNDNGDGAPGSDIWVDELGTISMRSNTSCFMQKVNGIYTPIRKFRPDHDDKEESDSNIEPSTSRTGFQISNNRGTSEPMAFGCKARDYVAYLMAGEYQFSRYKKYKKDWKDDEVKTKNVPSISGFNGEYGESIEVRPQNESKTRSSDKNQGFAGEAFCGVLPDGSVLLRDAWGSQVELRGGRVVISGANDVEITSGSNVVVTAGADVILKGADHCEMIAMNKDIRIRSGKMTMIESRGSGVQITAPRRSTVQLDGEGEEYATSGILLKSDNINFVGEKVEANASKLFCVQGQEQDNPPNAYIKSKSTINWTDNGVFVKTQRGHFLVSSGADVITTGNNLSEGFVVGHKGLATNGFCVAIDGPVATNGGVYGDIGGKLDPPIDQLEPMEIEEKVEPVYEISLWNELLRQPYRTEDYENIKFKNRTTQQYRTENAKWFEKFWQRQYKDSLKTIDYSQDKDDDDENSYPGKLHVDGEKNGFITYEEANVEKDGTPKKAEEQNEAGGQFKEIPYSKQQIKK
jgi:hypothetical protein